MSSPVRYGLIGCGAAGKIHAHAMRASPSSQLVAVNDCNPKAAKSLAERHGVPAKDLKSLLADPTIEAVSLAVPHNCHLEIGSQAAQAGKHLLVEKPFTLNVRQARALLEVGRDCGVVIVPWLERRYLPFVEQAREILGSGTLGSLVYTRVCTLGYKPRAYWEYGMRLEEYPSSWRGQRSSSGGGVLLMNAVHQIDLMAFITNLRVVEVTARSATLHHEVEVEDMAVATLVYANGAMGIVEASCCTFGINQFPIERPPDMLMGVDGNLELGKNLKCFDRIEHARTFEYPGMTVAEMKVELLENFAGHLRAGDPLRCTPRDAVQALAVVEACYRSAANRGAVQTPEAE